MKKWFLVLALVVLCVTPAWGEALPRELLDAVPEEARMLLDGELEETENYQALDEGISGLWKRGCKLLLTTLRESVGGIAAVLIVMLLCAVATDCFHASGSKGGTVVLAGTLVVLLAVMGSMDSMMGLGKRTLEELNVFSQALLPTLSAATAASGGLISASVRQVLTLLFSGSLLGLIEGVLLPLVWIYVAAAAAGAILPAGNLGGIAEAVRKLIIWILSGGLLLFTGYLSLSGAFAGSADRLALQVTRTTIGSVIPVVGGIISDAADSVLASAGVLRQSVGIFGTLVILASCLLPFVKLGVQYLLLRLCAFLSAAVAPGELVKLVEALSGAFGLVLAMTGTGALLLLISVASTVSAVSL